MKICLNNDIMTSYSNSMIYDINMIKNHNKNFKN